VGQHQVLVFFPELELVPRGQEQEELVGQHQVLVFFPELELGEQALGARVKA
jgi:hypothetical protein